MKNKGFTLAEVLVVIVITGIILVIAIPSVSNIINNRDKDTYDVYVKLVEEATKLYATKNRSSLLGLTASCIKIEYNTIKNEMELEEGRIKCSGNIVIKKTLTNNFIYEYYLDCVDSNDTYYSKNKNNTPTTCVVFP